MVVYLLCFDLRKTIQQQRDQIFNWLQFICSSVPDLPQFHYAKKNWRVMIVGLRSDEARSPNLVFPKETIQYWQSLMPNLPLFEDQIFVVSTTNGREKVQQLLESVKSVCSEIFTQHSLVPSSFTKLLKSIKSLNVPRIHVAPLYKQLEGECDMDPFRFKYALQFLHNIGHIAFFQNEIVCPSPTITARLLASFIAPYEVQKRLVSDNRGVKILKEGHVGSIQVVESENATYVFSHFGL